MIDLYVIAAHVVSMVCWFSGLFYIVRLFIYYVEAGTRPEAECQTLQTQFRLMQRRLWYGITWPAMVSTIFFGGWLMVLRHSYLEGWFHFKLLLVILLIIYHFQCGRFRRQCQEGTITISSFKLRLFNEGATLFLVGIVFSVYLKHFLNGLWLLFGIFCLCLLLYFCVLFYRKLRKDGKP